MIINWGIVEYRNVFNYDCSRYAQGYLYVSGVRVHWTWLIKQNRTSALTELTCPTIKGLNCDLIESSVYHGPRKNACWSSLRQVKFRYLFNDAMMFSLKTMICRFLIRSTWSCNMPTWIENCSRKPEWNIWNFAATTISTHGMTVLIPSNIGRRMAQQYIFTS